MTRSNKQVLIIQTHTRCVAKGGLPPPKKNLKKLVSQNCTRPPQILSQAPKTKPGPLKWKPSYVPDTHTHNSVWLRDL